jgi:hypothetical protein
VRTKEGSSGGGDRDTGRTWKWTEIARWAGARAQLTISRPGPRYGSGEAPPLF